MSELSPILKLEFAQPLNFGKDLGVPGELRWIETDKLRIDHSYQRSILAAGERNIRRIAEQFNWALFAPLVVAPREGGLFAIIDGQHKATAATIRGIKKLPCLVITADHALQARAFSVINGQVTRLHSLQVFRARVTAGESVAVQIAAICKQAGVTIAAYPKTPTAAGETLASGTLETSFNQFGAKALEATLLALMGAGGENHLIKATIYGTAITLGKHPKWLEQLAGVTAAMREAGVKQLLDAALKKQIEGKGREYTCFADQLDDLLRRKLGDGGFVSTNVRTRIGQDLAGRRFTGKPKRDPSTLRHLSADHPAIKENRTLFPTTVISAQDSERLLISGANSVKLGAKVMKGEWAGFPIYQLSLEERASCPPTCNNRLTCYGNAMPFARRHAMDEHLIPTLQAELAQLQASHPRGFVVRLHVLGDFFSQQYVAAWATWLKKFPALHVFGYTAWARKTPIGKDIKALTDLMWGRFAVRFSADESGPQGATTIWRLPEGATVPEGIVCPAQTDATACCATCGMCWSAGARDKTIVFVGHGGIGGRQPSKTSKPAAAKVRQQALKADAVRRAEEVHRLSQQKRFAPAKAPKAAADDRALIDAFIAKKGVRRFETAATGEAYHLVEWLRRQGHKVDRHTQGRGKKPFSVNGKAMDETAFYAFVNKIRSQHKLEPITRLA